MTRKSPPLLNRETPATAATPIRCLFVITSMPVGGAETLLVNLIRRLNPHRVQAEVVCLKERGPLGEMIKDEIPVHDRLLNGKFDLRVLPRLIYLFRRRRADVVVTVGAGDKMFWGRLTAWLAGVRGIVSALHSTGWPDGVGRLNRLLTPLTDAFIAVADSHGEFLRDFERFPADKVRVIRNGVDCDRFRSDVTAAADVRRELGIPPTAPLVGTVAALRPEKNHAMLVEVAARVQNTLPGVHWLIVGEGPERAAIERLRDQYELEDRVHLIGTRHDTPRLLAALDLFALTSLNEASPVSILEALACEVPAVATDVGSVSESIVDGETGLLVPARDADGFTKAILRLLENDELRSRLGQQGRRRVLESGSLQSMVEGYESLLLELGRRDDRRQPTSQPRRAAQRAATPAP